MATYYIGADVHTNNTELAIEQRGRIVARYSVPTNIPGDQLSAQFDPGQEDPCNGRGLYGRLVAS